MRGYGGAAAIATNRLLGALPAEDLAWLGEHLTKVELPAGTRMLGPRDRVAHNYFPLDGVVSMLMVLEDGTPIEVATVGREGFVSIESLLSVDLSPYEILCQSDVTALRIDVEHLRRAFRERAAVRNLLLRYTGVVLGCTGRSVGCKAAHTVEQRLARWLLMTRDRLERDELPLTHDLLAHMLGVRRPRVSQAAEALRDAGLIAYHRGKVTIVDRAGLLDAACEDYAVFLEEYERLLAPAPASR